MARYGTRMTKEDSIESIKHDLMSSKKIGNNTFEVVYKDGTRAIRLHKTDVVTFSANRYMLNTGGWQTVTTKDRINKYIPEGYVSQTNFEWSVRTPSGDVDYYDGIMFDYEGEHIPKVQQQFSVLLTLKES